MKTLIFCLQIFFPFSLGVGQSHESTQDMLRTSEAHEIAWTSKFEGNENQDDPGFSLYRKGYNYVLEEQWKLAREAFSKLVQMHPKSDYMDDAMYWRAYAAKHLDTKEAASEYQEFIKKYPRSRYFDDAIADLQELKSRFVVITPHPTTPPSPPMPEVHVSFDAPRFERQLRHLESRMRLSSPRIDHIRMGRVNSFFSEKDVPPEVLVKMDVLQTIRQSKKDEQAFTAIKTIALDQSQHSLLRLAALDVLADFEQHNPLTVFVEVIRKDTSEEIQNDAIIHIGRVTKDGDKSVTVLIDLFDTIPEKRKEQKHSVFYSIAEIGNNRAVDFLAKVARTNPNIELRSEAVYYLGTIGNDRARSALFRLLVDK